MTTGHLFDTCVIEQSIDPRAATKWPVLVGIVDGIAKEEGGHHISIVTEFEIRRGLRVLAHRGQKKTQLRRGELFLRRATVHNPRRAWTIAADLFAEAQVHEPSIKISDADLLIFSAARALDRKFVTSDRKLVSNLKMLGYESDLTLVELP